MSNRMEVRAAICGLAEAQMSVTDISKTLKVARTTVRRTLKKKEDGEGLHHDIKSRKKKF